MAELCSIVLSKKGKEGFGEEGLCVFVYGEPGLGKGPVAQLLHLFAPRSHDETMYKKLIHKARTDLPKPYQGCYRPLFKVEKLLAQWKSNAQSTWNECHSGQLKGDECRTLLFGNKSRPGMLTRAHLSGGTLFLDEIHTMDKEVFLSLQMDKEVFLSLQMDKEVFLSLHRVWGKPYQVLPTDGEVGVTVNVLTILAGNMDPVRLKVEGFDEALLSRITQYSKRLPPLRERKQDIAVLMNHFVRKWQEENSKLVNVNHRVESIAIEGLRLLTELSWKNTNSRGVEQFVDDLLWDRFRLERKWKTVGFDEIMRCAKRRDLL